MEEKEQSEYLKQLQLELDAPIETVQQFRKAREYCRLISRLGVGNSIAAYVVDELREAATRYLRSGDVEVEEARSAFFESLGPFHFLSDERVLQVCEQLPEVTKNSEDVPIALLYVYEQLLSSRERKQKPWLYNQVRRFACALERHGLLTESLITLSYADELANLHFDSEEARLNDKLSFYKTDEYRNPLLESLDEVLKKRSLFSSDLKQLKTSIEERIRH
ncbi:MAG TPA: hypothetical protein PLY72_17250 [Candidatus Obscuribacter sp.]|nr:hypothetical protein [Candidatus Obscuribacter sp.]HNG76222.1 hypothetical protein [Candidatus Obscuribacter sp.]